MARDRFERLLSMLHFTDNEKLPHDLSTAKRYEAKLGTQLSTLNANSAKLLKPARGLSVDEMMVKSYGRSVLRQYMPAKPNKYGIKLWSICCACCGYSLTQDLYLGSSVESVGGRKVVTQLAEPFCDRGHVIYCDRFFSHLDLAAYLKSRHTGMVGTSAMSSLPPDLAYLVSNMHPLNGPINGLSINLTSPTIQGNGLTKSSQLKSLSVSLYGWIRSIAPVTRKSSSLPTAYPQFQHLYRSNATVRIFASPPILKAYNYRMGGVDKHDRLVGQHAIPLTAKRGYIKIFFHVLDSAVVNACTKQ